QSVNAWFNRSRSAAGEVRDAEDSLRRARQVVAARQALVARFPDDIELRSDEALAHLEVAHRFERAGRRAEALPEFLRVRGIYEALIRLKPESTGLACALARAECEVGMTYDGLGRSMEAILYYENSTHKFQDILATLDVENNAVGHLCSLMHMMYGNMV